MLTLAAPRSMLLSFPFLFHLSFYFILFFHEKQKQNKRLEKLADAHRQRVILEAEAEAEAIRLNGEAQAYAIEAKAKAEAEQMSKKAAAFKEYREAAMVDMLLNTLPKVRLMEREYCIFLFLKTRKILGRSRWSSVAYLLVPVSIRQLSSKFVVAKILCLLP